ncbi:MAG TPA: DoxX family protein [Edaphobacter sp.]|jgi:hypothetical protein|nr:DoxX family protein [Edaphobacter sp.]
MNCLSFDAFGVTDLRFDTLFGEREEMKTFDHRLNDSWWALRIALGLTPIVAGVDKYFNKLADWGMYLTPYATKVTPVSVPTFMHLVGFIEIVAGVIVLSRWTRIGSYIVMAWLIAIAVNLFTTGMFYDLAVRDLEIAVGAFALSQLTVVREESTLTTKEQGVVASSNFVKTR